jgi:hypothetical protein
LSTQGIDTIYDWADGIDKIVVGSSFTLVNLYNSGASALLEFDAIDGSDLLFA